MFSYESIPPVNINDLSNIFDDNPLDESQWRIYQLLFSKKPRLAEMYKGGLFVLKQFENPERVVLAAHSFRELLEKLPEIVDVPVTNQNNNNIRTFVEMLYERFEHVKARSVCFNNGRWEGGIDEHIRECLFFIESEIVVVRKMTSPRKDQQTQMIRKTAGANYVPFEVLESNMLRNIKTLRNYFIGVAHHNIVAVEAEFLIKIEQLETLIHELFYPKVTEALDEIDQLIEELES